jgi:hypothetical protein
MAKRQKNRQHNGQKTEEQTTQWPKEKVQKDNNDLLTITHKAKDQTTRIPLKTGDDLKCSGRVIRSCPTNVTRRVDLVTNPVISLE